MRFPRFASTVSLILTAAIVTAGVAFPFPARAHEKDKPAADASPVYVCPMHPDVTDTKPGKCPKCGMTMVLKDPSHDEDDSGMDHEMTMPGHQAMATSKLAVIVPEPLVVGKTVTAVAKLTKPDGSPLTFADLELAHTKRIHLLIIDQSLSDYRHEHPRETATPGEFAFSFTPKHGGKYTVWADLLPTATGEQEYAKTEIDVPGAAAPLASQTNTTSVVDGYRFELSTANNQPLRAGAATLVTVKVTGPDGKPAANLEPIMAAFAHGVAFPADLSTVTHVHPMGREPDKAGDRGGPELSFHLLPASAGFLRFYVQVQIGGEGHDKYASFGLNVEPAAGEDMPRNGSRQ
jgi:hypothetical protein